MAIQYTKSDRLSFKIWQAVHTATITAKQKKNKNEESTVKTLTDANPDRDKEHDLEYRAVFAPFSICTVKYISFITKK